MSQPDDAALNPVYGPSDLRFAEFVGYWMQTMTCVDSTFTVLLPDEAEWLEESSAP